MKKIAIILAGGSGQRAGGGIPKQFRMLAGEPIILHSIKAFFNEDAATEIIIVCHRDWISHVEKLVHSIPGLPAIIIVEGGESRLHSVRNGLRAVSDAEAICHVAVHDSARPLITEAMLRRGWQTAVRHSTAIPVIDLVDSIREISGERSKAADRNLFKIVQTPQIFDYHLLRRAYEALDFDNLSSNLTDDASVVEQLGETVAIYDGEPFNLKITNNIDFTIASALMAARDNKC